MVSPSWIIQKKRDCQELKSSELKAFIRGIQSGDVADYQATAFLMATYFTGMTLNETVALTEAMLESGERYDLSHISGPKVDKHSTGGVGDKVSLILAPLASACGLKVPMMSGRGLGHSGGTIDKLESIPGFNVNLSSEKFQSVLAHIGCAMTAQTEKIAPADKKLYSLRDVTGTVECIPLITASILSKKLAEGTEFLVLDVKVGSGAFMKTRGAARNLAKTLIQVAKKLNLPCRALLTSMNQPLGYAVGNAIEVRESIEILKNEKNEEFSSTDLKELTLQLCAQMLNLGGISRTIAEGRKLAQLRLADGSAWQVFIDLIQAQGGDPSAIIDSKKIPLAPIEVQWKAKKRGFISRMDTEEIGKILIGLGGGRKKLSDSIDHRVGLAFHKKLGAKIQIDEPIVTVFATDSQDLPALEASFHTAVEISRARKSVPKLVFENYTMR